MARESKQVIVMRTDLNMRKGKMIAQGAHASIAWLTAYGENIHNVFRQTDKMPIHLERNLSAPELGATKTLVVPLNEEQDAWIRGSFTKICVRVDSEAELHTIAANAQAAGLTVTLIEDAGRTEFHGEKTYTCCAIGPNWAEDIDPITGHLALL